MLKIRLQRVGRKKNPYFRFVLTDSKNSTKSGKFHEVLGHFDFRKDGEHKISGERVKYWISKGAQVTPTVHNYLVDEKILSGKKINVLPRKSPPPAPTVASEKKEPAASKAIASQARAEEAPAAVAKGSAEPAEERREASA